MPDSPRSAAPATPAPRETRLADYQPPAYLIDTVRLEFTLDPAATRVRSGLALRRNPALERRGADRGESGMARPESENAVGG